jgi:hypothetical protein
MNSGMPKDVKMYLWMFNLGFGWLMFATKDPIFAKFHLIYHLDVDDGYSLKCFNISLNNIF